MSLLAHEELFLAIGELPGGDGGSVEVDSDGLAGGEGSFNGVVAEGDGGLGKRGTDADGGRLVGTIHDDGWRI